METVSLRESVVAAGRRRRLMCGLVVLGIVSCGSGAGPPTAPTPSAITPPHTFVYYLIYVTNPAEAAQRQAEHPTGVTNLSPESAARTYGVPIGGQTPGRAWTPPGILILASGTLYDPSVPRGTLTQTMWTDAFGHRYPAVTYEWVGYFAYEPRLAASPGVAASDR